MLPLLATAPRPLQPDR